MLSRLELPPVSATLTAVRGRFDALLEFGGSRYTLEYTYAKKNTTDQILLVDLPSVVAPMPLVQAIPAIRSRRVVP